MEEGLPPSTLREWRVDGGGGETGTGAALKSADRLARYLLKPHTRNPKSEVRYPRPELRSLIPETRNPKSDTRNPKSEVQNPKQIPPGEGISDGLNPNLRTPNTKPKHQTPIP